MKRSTNDFTQAGSLMIKSRTYEGKKVSVTPGALFIILHFMLARFGSGYQFRFTINHLAPRV
jgi:hypothetical protein